MPRFVSLLGLLLMASGILGAEESTLPGFDLPPGFPPPPTPKDNPLTAAKVELGRLPLFRPPSLLPMAPSLVLRATNRSMPLRTAGSRRLGFPVRFHPRNTMGLANVAYNASLNWADPQLHRLEDQMEIPMFALEPVEMGIMGHEEEVLTRLLGESRYGALFEVAFPEDSASINLENVILAIASFERTLISGSSPYDRYVYWDDRESLSDSACEACDFSSPTDLACSECHAGFNFSGPVCLGRGAARNRSFTTRPSTVSTGPALTRRTIRVFSNTRVRRKTWADFALRP